MIRWIILVALAIGLTLWLRWWWFEIQKEAMLIEAEEIKNAATD